MLPGLNVSGEIINPVSIFRHSIQENKGILLDPESGSKIDLTPLYM